MKFLIVHEVSYLSKIIYEFQILPEMLSLLGHQVKILPSGGANFGLGWIVVPALLGLLGFSLVYVVRLWRAANNPLAHLTLLDFTRTVCVGQIFRSISWLIEGRTGFNAFYYIAFVVIAVVLLALFSWLRPRSAVKAL